METLEQITSERPVLLLLTKPDYRQPPRIMGAAAHTDIRGRVSEIFSIIFGNEEKRGVVEKCVQTLTSKQSDRFDIKIEKDEVVDGLLSFMARDEETVRNPKFAGYFSRIAYAQVIAETVIPDLRAFLVKNMCNMAYMDLLATLYINGDFFATSDMVEWLADVQRRDLALMLCNRVMMSDSPGPLACVEVFDALLSIAASSGYSRLTALSIVERIVARCPDLAAMMGDWEERLFKEDIISDLVLPLLFRLFPKRVFSHFDAFLDSKSSTFVNDAFVTAIKEMNSADLEQFVTQHNVANRLNDAFGNTRTNGHIVNLAETMRDRKCCLGHDGATVKLVADNIGDLSGKMSELSDGARRVNESHSVFDWSSTPVPLMEEDGVQIGSSPLPAVQSANWSMPITRIATDDSNVNKTEVPSLDIPIGTIQVRRGSVRRRCGVYGRCSAMTPGSM